MQHLVVVGLIFEEIPNINVKGVKVNGARNIGQSHRIKVPAVCTLRRSTMQGLVVVYLIVDEILNVVIKCVKCTGEQNIGHGHRSRYLSSQYI